MERSQAREEWEGDAGIGGAKKRAQALGSGGGLSAHRVERRGVRLEHRAGEAEAENDPAEGGRDQIQRVRSLGFILCAKEASTEFKPGSERPGFC